MRKTVAKLIRKYVSRNGGGRVQVQRLKRAWNLVPKNKRAQAREEME